MSNKDEEITKLQEENRQLKKKIASCTMCQYRAKLDEKDKQMTIHYIHKAKNIKVTVLCESLCADDNSIYEGMPVVTYMHDNTGEKWTQNKEDFLKKYSPIGG